MLKRDNKQLKSKFTTSQVALAMVQQEVKSLHETERKLDIANASNTTLQRELAEAHKRTIGVGDTLRGYLKEERETSSRLRAKCANYYNTGLDQAKTIERLEKKLRTHKHIDKEESAIYERDLRSLKAQLERMERMYKRQVEWSSCCDDRRKNLKEELADAKAGSTEANRKLLKALQQVKDLKALARSSDKLDNDRISKLLAIIRRQQDIIYKLQDTQGYNDNFYSSELGFKPTKQDSAW